MSERQVKLIKSKQLNNNENKAKLTPKMMMQLAAPHTWSAAVMPVLVGMCFCMSGAMAGTIGDAGSGTGGVVGGAGGAYGAVFNFPSSLEFMGSTSWVFLTICMLVVSILMQSAVNTLNDYMDFKRGADTIENQLDATDAVLVYNNINPKSVLIYFFALMIAALALGLTIVYLSNITTLIIGLIGALILVFYSVGKTPLSYMPVGEVVSGVVMGSLIMVATCNVLAGEITCVCVLCSLPLVLTIGLINFTNNTCDIEKDIEAKRHTLSVRLGRHLARKAYTAVMVCVVVCVVLLVGVFFTRGLVVCLFMLLAIIPVFKALLNNPLVLESRGAAMGGAVNFNILINTFYSLAMLVSVSFPVN